MPSNHYHFLTRWRLEAPLSNVWDTIYDSMQWPSWWRGVVSVTEQDHGDENGINSIRTYTWKGRLPYKLRFSSKLLENDHGRLLHGHAFGDLEGKGTWRFSEADGITTLECEWEVCTTKKWMSALSFLLRPLFSYNHHLVMRWGAEGLARKLNVRLIAY